MKYIHLLLISVIIPSVILSMEIKHSSSRSKKTSTHRKQTTIFISSAMNKNRDLSIKLDRNGILNMNSKTKGPRKSSPRNYRFYNYEQIT